MHFLCTKEKEKFIEDHVVSDATVARMRVEDAEAAMKQEQEEMTNAENAGLTTTEPENMFE